MRKGYTTAPKKKKSSKGYNKDYVKKTYNPRYDPPALIKGAEKKWFDVDSALTCPIGSAFVVTPAHLNAIGQGATNQSRIGFKARMKSVLVRMNILWNTVPVASAPAQVRYVLVWDKQANGALPARGDIFADGTVMMSPTNLANSERFVILADQVSQPVQNTYNAMHEMCFRKCDLEMLWTGTNTIQSTGTLTLWVAANSDVSDATSAHFPSVQFYSRVRYTDQ